jgi:hypothetical protein
MGDTGRRWEAALRAARADPGLDLDAEHLLALLYTLIAHERDCPVEEVSAAAIRYRLIDADRLYRELSDYLPGPEPDPDRLTGLEALAERLRAQELVTGVTADDDLPWSGPPPPDGQQWQIWQSLQAHRPTPLADLAPSDSIGPGTAGAWRDEPETMFYQAARHLARHFDRLLLAACDGLPLERHVQVRAGAHAGRSGRILAVTWECDEQQVTQPASFDVGFDDVIGARAEVDPQEIEPLPQWDYAPFVVVHAGQPAPPRWCGTVFLGDAPATRGDQRSWQHQALAELERRWLSTPPLGRLVVFTPHPARGTSAPSPQEQAAWEEEALRRADVILLHDPRLDQGRLRVSDHTLLSDDSVVHHRLLLSSPADTSPTGEEAEPSLHGWARQRRIPLASTLTAAVEEAVERIGAASPRSGAERDIPVTVRRTDSCRAWLSRLRDARIGLVRADVEWIHPGDAPGTVDWWAIRATLRHSRDRDAITSELVVGRPWTLSLVVIHHRQPWTDSQVLLVPYPAASALAPDGLKSFPDGHISMEDYHGPLLRLPGADRAHRLLGSEATGPAPGAGEVSDGQGEVSWALAELADLTGLLIDPRRCQSRGERPGTAAVASLHRVIRIDLTAEEAHQITAAATQPEARIRLVRVADVLANALVDWTTLGIIARAVTPTYPPASGDLNIRGDLGQPPQP